MTGEQQQSIEVVHMSLDRIRDVAALHRMAFSGYLNTKLGLPYLRAFLRWFCEGEEAIALCALRAGEPVGYVVGAPLGYTQALNRSVFVPALAGILLRPWLIFDGHFRQTVAGRWQAWRGRDPLDDAPDLPMPTFSLVGIAVHPAARGKRIGQQLIDAFEAQARAAGACALRLSVYSDNKAAQRLYTRAGWSHHPRGGAHADYYYKLLEKDSTVASAFPGASVHFTGKDGR